MFYTVEEEYSLFTITVRGDRHRRSEMLKVANRKFRDAVYRQWRIRLYVVSALCEWDCERREPSCDWKPFCKPDICAATPRSEWFCAQPKFAAGKSLYRKPGTWMVFPSSECICKNCKSDELVTKFADFAHRPIGRRLGMTMQKIFVLRTGHGVKHYKSSRLVLLGPLTGILTLTMRAIPNASFII